MRKSGKGQRAGDHVGTWRERDRRQAHGKRAERQDQKGQTESWTGAASAGNDAANVAS